MKLLTYDTGTGPRCGVLRGDDVVDVSALLGAAQPLRDVRAFWNLGNRRLTGCETRWPATLPPRPCRSAG